MNQKNPVYTVVDTHVFKPASVSAATREEIILYFPLMAGESNNTYIAKNSISQKKCLELQASREKFCEFFSDILSSQVSHDMSPRSKIKHIICSAAIKAAEISLWTTYSLFNLPIDEKIKLVKSNKLKFTQSSFRVANEYAENERNEKSQEFRLVQFRIRWTEKGKRKSIWSKLNPISSGEWFNSVADSDYSKSVKEYAPLEVPELRIQNSENLSTVSIDRIDKYRPDWQKIIKERYEIARLTASMNDIDLSKVPILLFRDDLVKELDTLITLESNLIFPPSLDDLLPKEHLELISKFSKYDGKYSETICYNDEDYEIHNIKFCPAVYDLADNVLDTYSNIKADVL